MRSHRLEDSKPMRGHRLKGFKRIPNQNRPFIEIAWQLGPSLQRLPIPSTRLQARQHRQEHQFGRSRRPFFLI
jgi:hypothetical protein